MNLEFLFWGSGGGGGRRGWSDDGKQSILLGWPYPFYCCYARSSSYNLLQWQYRRLFFSNFWTVSPFSTKKKLSFLGTINFLFQSRLRAVPLRSVMSKLGRTGESEFTRARKARVRSERKPRGSWGEGGRGTARSLLSKTAKQLAKRRRCKVTQKAGILAPN